MSATRPARPPRPPRRPPRPPRRRVVVTGLGVVSCCGTNKDAFFQGLMGPGPEGERRVHDFDPLAFFGPKEARRVDRFTHFAVSSAVLALEDAGSAGALDCDPARIGVLHGTGVGGLETLEEQIGIYRDKGARRVSPFLVPMIMGNRGAAEISMRWGFRGPCEAIVTACASGTHAIGAAMRAIGDGRCDVVVTGGAEAAMTPVGVAAFTNMTAMSSSGWSRPFDARRDGFMISEGGATLILEEMDRARARGARIYAEVLGAASTADAHHITAPIPGGAGAQECIELALDDAGLAPQDIAHVNAHGTSTPLNDLAEAEAIEKVWGLPGPPVTSIKGVTGHSLGAAGAMEAVACALTIERRLIPPTVGYEQPDPDIHIDIVAGAPREFVPGPIISNSFGFGGHNGCVIIGPLVV